VFPEPFGAHDVIEVPLTEAILIARHLRVSDVRNYINGAPLRDLRDQATPEPVATDERGHSNQQFLIEVLVRNGNQERRASARGRDIYAVTAPIAVDAVERVYAGAHPGGRAFALGQIMPSATADR
jgi:hypothetical protein